MMLRGGGHELNQAGQDSLLEQMEAPRVKPINDIFDKNKHVHLSSTIILLDKSYSTDHIKDQP